MQNVINTVKGKALEVAEYLTPVLKVRGRAEAWRGVVREVLEPLRASGWPQSRGGVGYRVDMERTRSLLLSPGCRLRCGCCPLAAPQGRSRRRGESLRAGRLSAFPEASRWPWLRSSRRPEELRGGFTRLAKRL